MKAMSRPLAILAAAAIGGAAFGSRPLGHGDDGGYWAMLGVAALVGLMLALAQLRSPDANATGMLVVAWVPITIAAGWVLVTAQPEPNTFRDQIREWNADLGLADVAHYLSPFVAVLALGIGLVFGLTLLASWAMRETETTVVDEAPAEPVAAEPVAAPRPRGGPPAAARVAPFPDRMESRVAAGTATLAHEPVSR